MDELAALLERYHAGAPLAFGPGIALSKGTLQFPGASLPINTLQPLHLDANGCACVRQIGSDEPLLVVPSTDVDDLALFVRVTNHLIAAIPSQERRSITGWPPGSVGDVSARIGYDVRDLLVAGYTHDQISGLLQEEYTLEELLEQGPGASSSP